ncbi:A/G-specific adenine glycosylase [Flavobacterium sp. JP2137]|uniref:A/G-specific adenine glycosylase n=1 Tax=Flavobacterium sp. JP2137 TaxID=3414510 RepID=UPI003D2FAF4D
MLFSNKLIAWYLQNKRDLPWRKTRDPYAIWLSEIILQQTRVAQGMPYYEAFLTQYPSVFDLAQAPEDQVLKLWQGLGYYSRARNLHATAKKIAEDFDGVFPTSYKELLLLKGVGTYTAAAIASISFDEQVAVVDGNVFRVLARYFGIISDIATSTTKKEFTAVATALLPPGQAAVFNQAIMDFGATVCTPKKPLCTSCVFLDDCVAYHTNQVPHLPVKLSKTKVSSRFLNYLIYKDSLNQTQIQQRTDKDIWQQLYEFPLIETPTLVEERSVHEQIYQHSSHRDTKRITKLNAEPIIHKLSHRKLHINFWEIEVNHPLNDGLSFSELKKFAFPIVIHNFIVQHYE